MATPASIQTQDVTPDEIARDPSAAALDDSRAAGRCSQSGITGQDAPEIQRTSLVGVGPLGAVNDEHSNWCSVVLQTEARLFL